mgnify:FL=1
MANNYTTNLPTTLELQGDNVSAGTIPLTYDIVITPSPNHVVQAADFSIGDALGVAGQLPIEVTTVSFTDTSTANTAGNTVIATVTLAQWFTMPATAVAIEVDIDGKATRLEQPRLSFTTTSNIIGGSKGSFITVSGVTRVTGVERDDETAVDNEYFVDIPANSQALVATYLIDASISDEGYYPSLPQHEIISSDPSRWSSQVTSVVYGTANDTAASFNTGQIIYYRIDFYYEIGDSAVPLSEGNYIIATTVAPIAFTTPAVSIDKVRYSGYKNQGILPSRDIDLLLGVSGSPGATYDILVQDDNGLSYDFTLNTFTRSLTKLSEQTINLGSPTIATTQNSHSITVPAYNEKAALSKFITTTVTPTGNTKTTADGVSTDPYVITLNQFGEVDSTIAVTPATDGVTATTATLLSFQNKTPLSYPTIFNPTDFPLLSTANNSYFNISTPLSYTITDTVASGGAFSGTAMVMTTDHTTKKVVVGDTVTGTNIASATVVSAVNVDSNLKAYTLSKSPTGEVAAGATITFTRNVGISRQPLTSDFLSNLGLYKIGGEAEHQVTQATVNSLTVQVFDDDGDYASIVNGQTVQGQSIIGYPTVVSGGGANNLVLSTVQTLPSGEQLTFSNAMSGYDILDISVTGAGTTDCKLNVEGHINRVGHADVDENLILQNFITSYVAPVATAQAVDCPLGGSVKVFPVAASHTSVLTIAAVGGRSSSATISDDGSYLLYLAPTTGTAETITYTVNDGINTSAAANIVVTLTT